MANLYFFLVGGVTTALAFMSIGLFNRMGFKTIDDFSGVGRKAPFTSLALLLSVFSFAGVPPLAGFIAKYLVFTAAIEANLGWLAVIGVLASIVQTAYLLRLINHMYARGPQERPIKIKEPKKLLVPIFVLAITIIILGIYPTIVLNLIQPAAKQLSRIP
jgi:NADH:ubiquinone oxidoreductase subunit 2 (subunit N)